MRVLKLKAFARWARKEGVLDSSLRIAVREMQAGLVDANLGGGLVKKRVARPGRGKSTGYRTIVAAVLRGRWVFLYGFAKSERDNVPEKQLRALHELGRAYLGYDEGTIDMLAATGKVVEVDDGESQAS